MANYAIIVAAGEGRRFGGLKQFHMICGKPILIHTLKNFEDNDKINAITVVVPKDKVKLTKNLVRKDNLKKVLHVISGGKRRQDSVYKGLKTINDNNCLVIIHDGVRPIVPQNLINDGIKLCKKHRAVIFGLPISDTVKAVTGHIVSKTIPRKGLYLIQTPQFFEMACLKDAYRKIDFKKEFTDEASMLESLNIPVYLFTGERDNIKITTKQDLKFLRHLSL